MPSSEAPDAVELVSDMAVAFMRVGIDEIDREIERALERLGAFLSARRIAIVHVFDDDVERVGYRWPVAPAGDEEDLHGQALLRRVEAAGGGVTDRDGLVARTAVAMFTGARLTGVLCLEAPVAELEQHVRRLPVVAQLLHHALERRRLAEAEAARNERGRALQDALVDLSKRPEVFRGELPAALQAIAEVGSWAVGTRYASVWLLSEDGATARRACSFDIRAGEHQHASLVRSWEELLGALPAIEDGPAAFSLPDVAQWPMRAELARVLDRADLGALMVTVTRARGRIAALVAYEHADERRSFSAEDRGFAVSLSGVVSNVLEAAEHRRVSDEVRLQEERYRNLVELSPDAIFLESDGTLLYVNDAAVNLLGAPSRAKLLAEPSSLLRPDAAEGNDGHRPVDPLSARGTNMVEERWRTLGGQPLTVEVSRLVSSHEGKIATQVVARDLAERKRLSAKVMAVDRMIAMGTLAAGIGHEINNPLSYVLGNLDQARSEMESGDAEPDDVIELLREAEEGATRIRDVVRDLRTFTRASEERRGAVSLEAVLESAIRMAQNEIRHRARLVRDYRTVHAVEGNDGRLRQVVLNLLINSAHSIPEGNAKGNEITVRLAEHGGEVLIQVRDTGSGMPAHVVQQIFEPFFTTKAAGQGTGLGLTISRQIVEAHGGRMDIESEVGQGTTVSVRLPKLHPKEVEPAVESEPPARPDHRPHLLVIDDEPIICRTVARLLAGEFEVTGMTSGLDALDDLRSGHCPFDLILCDIMMPDLTGMDLHASLCRDRPEIARRILFVTGGAFTPRARRFIEEMHDRVLDKPLDGERLRDFVRGHLTRIDEPRDGEATGRGS